VQTNQTQAARFNKAAVQKALAPTLSQQDIPKNAPIFIRIFKQSGELELWMKNRTKKWALVKTYPICYFSGFLGPKLKEGDKQSPEGFYKVSARAMNPNSTYHLSFNLGFPNRYDRANGRTGSYLMVHGNCVSIGCYAMTDEKIEEIYTLGLAAFKGGQKTFPVHIFPFRMTDENMAAHQGSQWVDFWNNLKQGYDIFENDKVVPKVSVAKKRYTFSTPKVEQ